MEADGPINVCVTGAAGQIAYSLLFLIGRGHVFGPNQKIVLHLLDIRSMMDVLRGVVMELQDCVLPTLLDIKVTFNMEEAFRGCDVAILVGAMPRREGMERRDLLEKNAKIFQVHGRVLDAVAKKSVKVLVVGNPANTNALITSTFAPSIPRDQFTCLTMLDQNRAKIQLALRLGVRPEQIKNLIIWGNHSTTQYPDVQHAYVLRDDGSRVGVVQAVNDDVWLAGEFVSMVQRRGAAVIKARKLSSAMSAAKAIADHMRVWWQGTPGDEMTSMGVFSDGSYGIREGVVYSHPVTIKNGRISIVQGLKIAEFSREKMEHTAEELFSERDIALRLLTDSVTLAS